MAAGESTSDWETGGVVCVKSDIDMAGVEDWPGVGTASSPFTGKFDGGGHAVLNLTGSCGLFNYCKDAEVRDIALGKGSSLFNSIPFGRKGCLGGIVSQAENSLISGCSLVGAIDFAALSEEDDPLVYVGGIVGWADSGSRIEDAKVSGSVNVSSTGGSDVVCYLGGVAGLCEGALTSANVLGAVSFSSGIAELHAGGVQGALAGGAVVQGNTFTGSLTLGGNASWAALGGLYGSLVASHSFDKGSDDSSSMGTIQINSYRAAATAAVYAGGFVGFVPGACSLALKGYAVQTNISMDFASAVRTAGYVCAGGFLGGCDPGYAAGPLEFDGLTSSGAITGKYSTAVACNVRRTWLGGIAGYLNGPSRFNACVNRGEVGKTEADDYCARSNSYGEVCGGIAGFVHGGDALFSACENHAGISEHLYNNNGVSGVYEGIFTPPVVGGILGAFNYFSAPENFTLTVNNCVNTKNIFGYRGYNGGIVGFCVNATVSGCENTGRLSNGANDQSAYRGGICGAAGNASILDCKATSDVFARVYGSADYGCGGGILGLVRGDAPVTLRGCSFFGTVQANKQSTDKPEYPGGIVGMGTDATTVADCRYGGSVQGLEITENNVASAQIVVGNGLGTISGITYWSGK
ncbi:MAG: hypothetical protein IJS62_02830 [Bacteroidales bacterium]|nr:hypothetical protein [Bacteroidales bacterium]